MTNCKHGNGPDCQQCQYERDVASGYPEPWRLWGFNYDGGVLGSGDFCEMAGPISEFILDSFESLYRRPDADEIIKEWERGIIAKSGCGAVKCHHAIVKNGVVCCDIDDVYVDEDGEECCPRRDGAKLVEDKCATCRPALPEPMREEPRPGTRMFVADMVKNEIIKTIWIVNYRKKLNACLCHTTRESAQEWLDWWNEAVGRKA